MAPAAPWSTRLINLFLAVAVFIAVAALNATIGAEFLGWLPVLVRVLVGLAVRQLPDVQRERYREEFLSDIESKAADRNVTALVWAIGTCITARGLARTLREHAARLGETHGGEVARTSHSFTEYVERLAALTSFEFEELIVELFRRDGYDVTVIPATRNHDAYLHVTGRDSWRAIVECKQSDRPINAPLILQLERLVEGANADCGIFVTTSVFTRGAARRQREHGKLLMYGIVDLAS